MNNRLSQNTIVGTTVSIVLGLLVLLLGMRMVSHALNDLWASVVDVLFVLAGLMLICYNVGLRNMVGNRAVKLFLIVVPLLTLFSLWFGISYVYTFNESGQALLLHEEHDLAYNRILAIADQLNNGSFSDAYLLSLSYGQYAHTYLYSSLMYVFGGNVITHMCVWNGFHLGIMGILSVLVASASGIKDRRALHCILFMVILQPTFWTLFAYNRNIVGESFLLLGLLIFVKGADNPLKALALLPIYGFLFYAFRLQYLLIAISLFLIISALPPTKRGTFSIIGLFLSFIVLTYMVNGFDWATDVGEGLNVDNYLGETKGFLTSILLGLIGKFPWTNLFSDSNWTYHLFASLQAPMMLILYYYVFKKYKKSLNDVLFNPVLMCGIFLWTAGMICSTHTTYLAVAAPMLIISIADVGIGKLEKSYLRVSIVFVILSFLYSAIGLTGSGMISH